MARSFYGVGEDDGSVEYFNLGEHMLFDLHEDEIDYICQEEDED